MAPNFVDVREVYSSGKVKEEDVKALKAWVDSQPHLPNISELDTILFLHSCHCSNEAAKQCIDTYYSIRTHCPEFFKDQDPRKNAKLFDRCMLYTILPRRKKDDIQILLGHFVDPRPSAFNFDKVFKSFDMTTMLELHQYGPADGFILLQDLAGLTVTHLTKINLLHLKKYFMYLQEALPVRLKGLHFINIVPFIDKIMIMIKPFLKDELRQFIFFHQDLDAMKKYIDLECLPSNFGGAGPSLTAMKKTAEDNLMANVEFFVDMETKLVDESKRPGKPKNAGDFFGIEGTFKKLEID